MNTQTQTGAFPRTETFFTVGDLTTSQNLFDQTFNNYPPQWSNGQTLVAALSEQPYVGTQWQISGWSISFSGLLEATDPTGSYFGKLGKLYGGLLTSQGIPPAAISGSPLPYSQFPIPPNAINIGLMWDGSSDDPFPGIYTPLPAGALQNLHQLTFNQQLPTPINLASGDDLFLAMWLTPMLAKNVGLWVCNATWGVEYQRAETIT